MAHAGLDEVLLDLKRAQCGDGEGGDDGHQDLQRLLVPADGAEDSDERAEHGCGGDIERGRVQDQAQPDRENRVAGDALQLPESRLELMDLGQSPEPVGRHDGAALGVPQQLLEGGYLVEARRAESGVVTSTAAGSPRPIVTIR